MKSRVKVLLVPVLALVTMLASGVWLATMSADDGWFSAQRGDWGGQDGGSGPGSQMMGGTQMMGGSGYGWSEGDADPVSNLDEARDRAEEFARTFGAGLRVGEVMRFTNHYYAEIEESDGTNATEVLVDPGSGAVQPEFGPAMMWNTEFSMMSSGGSGTRLSSEEARAAAEEWLDGRGGLTVDEPEEFPGYYTVHTLRDGEVDGMLSVHAVTGAVWYHNWHGEFLEMSEEA